jgi:uncharacterized protein (TIGR00730 family)
MLRSVCVFCGARPGRDPAHLDAARQTGAALAERGVRVVFGGGSVGMMGAVADAALDAGGEVVGVIPRALVEREAAHPGTDLRVVGSMHERKALMAELSDAFIALPGGIGTLEELFEVWTWGTLGLHGKPLGLLEVDGFWAPLVAFLDATVDAGFLTAEARGFLHAADDLGDLLGRLAAA